MKTFLKILLIALFFLVLLGAILFKLFYSPSQPPQADTGTQFPIVTDTQSKEVNEVQAAFLQQIDNADKINLANAKVVYPYALQNWNDENKGGQALLKFDSGKGWQLVNLGGGAWDVESLVAVGVPEDIAHSLIGS